MKPNFENVRRKLSYSLEAIGYKLLDVTYRESSINQVSIIKMREWVE